MDVGDEDLDAILQAIDEASSPVKVVGITCTQASPLLVSVEGTSPSVPAEAMAGSTFAPGDTGRALWSPPSKPICFKVT